MIARFLKESFSASPIQKNTTLEDFVVMNFPKVPLDVTFHSIGSIIHEHGVSLDLSDEKPGEWFVCRGTQQSEDGRFLVISCSSFVPEAMICNSIYVFSFLDGNKEHIGFYTWYSFKGVSVKDKEQRKAYGIFVRKLMRNPQVRKGGTSLYLYLKKAEIEGWKWDK